MLELFLKGGVLMYPLLLCTVIAVAVILERGIQFLRAGSGLGWLQEAQIMIRNRAFSEAAAFAKTQSGPVALLLGEVIEHRDLPRSELETRLSSVGSKELKRLSVRLHLLELIGKIAPMLGLSGTVLGLTRTFQTVAAVQNIANPGLLAHGIWEALITTVTGLFIGIPTLVFHHLLENQLKSLSFEMKSSAETMLTELGGSG
ncbi:MAG: MotA/TolQ/ExbB proton channel family protein [Spirochaetia bacterium]